MDLDLGAAQAGSQFLHKRRIVFVKAVKQVNVTDGTDRAGVQKLVKPLHPAAHQSGAGSGFGRQVAQSHAAHSAGAHGGQNAAVHDGAGEPGLRLIENHQSV